MKRLSTAPNLMLATLWADMMTNAGFATSVQRAYASGIAGEIPPDQALPELWIESDDQFETALVLFSELTRLPDRHWVCAGCDEVIDGPFNQCWKCGMLAPIVCAQDFDPREISR